MSEPFVSIWDSPAESHGFSSFFDASAEPVDSEPEVLVLVPEPAVEPVPEPEPEPDIAELIAEAEKRAYAKAALELMPERQAIAKEREQIRALAGELTTARSQMLDDASAEIAAIVLGLARRVVGDALVLHPDALQSVVSGAVGRFPEPASLTIRVAPDDVERVAAWLPMSEVVADPAISGGCMVESDAGSVEASLETVMQGLDTAVTDWLAEGA
ncbi:MAG: hypothetical protein GY913_15765 [Proteobacteria bacterium]|nr:hypothetical protein [Pseudomonadota bacterium]MCP4918362.1 hypothetical protein [Pseudomonadota bacterium]